MEDRWKAIDFNAFIPVRTTRDTESNASVTLEGEHVSWKDSAIIVHAPVMPYPRRLTKDDLVSPEFGNNGTLLHRT
ncbi:MAG: hypothetical protein ACTHZ1_11755 [Sphingobacterium sp.]